MNDPTGNETANDPLSTVIVAFIIWRRILFSTRTDKMPWAEEWADSEIATGVEEIAFHFHVLP